MDNFQLEEQLTRIENLLLCQKTVLDFNEAAEFTGLSKSFLYKMSSTGGVPCYCPNGKKLYFNRVELEKWLLRNKKKTHEAIEHEVNSYLVKNLKGGRS